MNVVILKNYFNFICVVLCQVSCCEGWWKINFLSEFANEQANEGFNECGGNIFEWNKEKHETKILQNADEIFFNF